MRRSRYSDDQIRTAVRQVQEGASEVELTRQLGISEATFHVWKKRFDRATSESAELDRLRNENSELKRLVAELTFDRQLCNATHLTAVIAREPPSGLEYVTGLALRADRATARDALGHASIATTSTLC
jgi:putative transposase